MYLMNDLQNTYLLLTCYSRNISSGLSQMERIIAALIYCIAALQRSDKFKEIEAVFPVFVHIVGKTTNKLVSHIRIGKFIITGEDCAT